MDRTRIDRIVASLFCSLFLAASLLLVDAAQAAPEPRDMGAIRDLDSIEDTIEEPTDSRDTPHAPSQVVIRGVVRDANGGPVRGATIRLMSETDTVEVQSDRSGKFRGKLTALRDVEVMVRAYGYRDLVRNYRASRSVIQAALALPPPYPLGWVTVTFAEPVPACTKAGFPAAG